MKIVGFIKGKVAIGLEWPAIIPIHENPKESVVAGKLGFFVMPKGPVRRAAVTGTWTLNIPTAAKNKDGAVKFSYWLGSYEVGKQLIKAGMSPIRYDLLKDPELSKTDSLGFSWMGIIAGHSKPIATLPELIRAIFSACP